MKKIYSYLTEPLKKEKNIIIFISMVFLIGLIFGSLFINFINKSDKKLLIDNLKLYFDNIKHLDKTIYGVGALLKTFSNEFLQLLLIFILGLSILGVLGVIIIMFFKGFTCGVTLGIIIYKYSFKGVIGALFYVFPCYVINISIYLFLSFYAIYISNKFVIAFIQKNNLNFKTFLGKYILSFILSTILILIISLLDVYITPLLLKIFVSIL